MFHLTTRDNDLELIHGRDDIRKCSTCGTPTHKWEEDLSVVPIPKPPPYDASYTWDGVLVVSPKFKTFVEQSGIGGLDFRPLQGGVYSAMPTVVLRFDAVRRQVRFLDPCAACGIYDGVIGATPVFLLPGSDVPDDGFARTDLDFGSSDRKSPVILCGDVAAERLYSVKFRGIHLVRESWSASD